MVSVLNYISFYDRDLHGTHPQLLTLHELFKAASMLSTLRKCELFQRPAKNDLSHGSL